MPIGVHRLGGKATQKQYLNSKATLIVHLNPKSKPARRRRTGPF